MLHHQWSWILHEWGASHTHAAETIVCANYNPSIRGKGNGTPGLGRRLGQFWGLSHAVAVSLSRTCDGRELWDKWQEMSANSRLDRHLALSVIHCYRAKHWLVFTKYQLREAGCVTISWCRSFLCSFYANHVMKLKVVYLKKYQLLIAKGPK